MAAMSLIPHCKPPDSACRGRAGQRLAARKRWLSGPALGLALGVWMLWPAVVVQLPAAGLHYSINQLFWLAALPSLSGATSRVFLAFPVPLAGARRFTALATAGMLLPVLGTALAVQDPGTPFEYMVVLALLFGLGGGQVASSMAHIALAAWFGRDKRAELREGFAAQAVIFTRRHTWLMCWLLLGSLGSFIGFCAALPLLLQTQFNGRDLLPWVWFGLLAGAWAWPAGGWLADHSGGARVSFWCFVLLALGAVSALLCLPSDGQGGSLQGFLLSAGLLLAAAGAGSGSNFCMIARLFPMQRQRAAEPLPAAQAQAAREGRIEAAAVMGFAGAIGAYGGFFIPKSFGTSMVLTGSPAAALLFLIAFYLSCIALTWWQCSRRHAPHPC